MRRIALFLVALLLSVTLVSVPASAFNGFQLTTSSVGNFTLTDENNSEMKFSDMTEDIVVVSFFFTRCTDVCPIITQNLKMVQQQIPDEIADDVGFVSITLDPRHDTPEVMNDYMSLHGVEWPHLTGNSTELADVWSRFGMAVQEIVTDPHDDNMSDMDGQIHNSSVVYTNENGTSMELMFLPTGMTLTTAAADEAGWSLNTSESQFGTMVNGINGYDSPEDWSWWWSLKVFNETSEGWEDSPVGVDSVNALEEQHIAWFSSQANASLLMAPVGEDPSVQVVFPDNTTAFTNVSGFTGYHLTQGAFDGAEIDVDISDSSFGHFLNSINGVSAPADWSWWWELHTWNQTNMTWEDSQVGMDLLDDPMTIAWAPNSTDNSAIPAPGFATIEATECSGNGWIMGSGQNAHCMCDAGYEWAEDDMLRCVQIISEDPEYTVGHSTITYILDDEKKPRVSWLSDKWLPEEFVEDIVTLAEKEGLIEIESEGIPSIGFILSVVMISMAAISLRAKSE